MSKNIKTFEEFDEWVSTSTNDVNNYNVRTTTSGIKPRSQKIDFVDRLLYKLGIKFEFNLDNKNPVWSFTHKNYEIIISIKAGLYYIKCESDVKGCPNYSGLDEYLLRSKLSGIIKN